MAKVNHAVDLARAPKTVKTLFGWLFFRRLSMPLSLRLAETRVMPIHLTLTGLAFGLAGAGMLWFGTYAFVVAGALMIVIAKVLDAADGEVARAKHLDTPLGYVVDGLSDRFRDTAVILGAGIGVHRGGYDLALEWTIAAVVGYLLFFYISGAFPSHWREIGDENDLDDKHMFRVTSRVRLGAGDTLVTTLVVASLLDNVLWWVIAIAVASPLAVVLKTKRLIERKPWDREQANRLGSKA